jgi:hypothetical protein
MHACAQGLSAEPQAGLDDVTGDLFRQREHLMCFYERLSKRVFPDGATMQWKAKAEA